MDLRFPKPEKRVKARKAIKRGKRPRRRRAGTPAAISRECDRLWSKIVRSRYTCEAAKGSFLDCAGQLQAAHGFSRRYRNTRWLPINGFALCAGHHVWFTYDPLGWDDWLRAAWGQKVYDELRRLAQRTTKPDAEDALRKLAAEAQQRGIS